MLEQFASWIVSLIYTFGYAGIIISMTIESTFIPLPSELILLPAGYLWYKGLMNPFLIVICAIIGSLIGSYFSYWLGERFGRPFLYKYLKYFFLNEKRLKKVDAFFERYGPISIFFGRLIFGVRHYISFPAGFAKMNKWKFLLYTGLGSGLWSIFLMFLGYFVGTNLELVENYITYFTVGIILIAVIFITIYVIRTYLKWKELIVNGQNKKQETRIVKTKKFKIKLKKN